jgi:hypothetical protein
MKNSHPYTRTLFISFLRKCKIKYTKLGERIIVVHENMRFTYFTFCPNYIEINQRIPFKRKISVYTPDIIRFLKWTQKTGVIDWQSIGVKLLESEKTPV